MNQKQIIVTASVVTLVALTIFYVKKKTRGKETNENEINEKENNIQCKK